MSTALANSPNPGSREKILDVAEVLFARQGFAGISMNDVASPVGLSKSSLFHHFSGKLELYAEVCERVLGRIAVRVLPALEGTGPCGEKLDAAVGSLCDVLSEHPHTARLLLRALALFLLLLREMLLMGLPRYLRRVRGLSSLLLLFLQSLFVFRNPT